jgi:hypothetical protein
MLLSNQSHRLKRRLNDRASRKFPVWQTEPQPLLTIEGTSAVDMLSRNENKALYRPPRSTSRERSARELIVFGYAVAILREAKQIQIACIPSDAVLTLDGFIHQG